MKNIEKLSNSFQKCILIQNPKNRRYLSGFSSSDGMLLIADKPYLILDFRYVGAARIKKSQGIIPDNIEIIMPQKSFIDQVRDILESKGIDTLFFEDDYLSFREYSRLKEKLAPIQLLPLGNAVNELRKIKSPAELEKIKSAQKITDLAFEHILNFINPDSTETEIAAELEHFMALRGACPAFDTICVSGIKSSLPHGVPENIRLTNNSFLTMDFGACVDGYCSDMTRTVVIGKADSKMKEIYNIVLKAQSAAFSIIKGGIDGKVCDSAARDVIYNAGYQGCFGHSLGHSLGLDIHESPNFSPSNPSPVPSGCVLSVEPGIYIDGLYGVRIEDIVYLTDDGFINLTKSTKELIEI
ncbi:MAG: aminopeptidase P family protein [Clostridia bacterium]|nr:aminopeptidase P family protein [Clostridia bacterium]